MHNTDNHTFKNEASRRFHDYFYALTKESSEARRAVYEAFGLAETKNPSQFFSKLRTGAAGVTVEHVYIAKEKFDMNPGYWFEVSTQQKLGFDAVSIADDHNQISYSPPRKDNRRVGKVLHDILRRHGTEIKGYAQKRLHMTEQNLHKIFRGEVTASWWLVQQVVEDHGESMELLRAGPLPKDHYLSRIQLLEERAKEQSELISILKTQVNKGNQRASA